MSLMPGISTGNYLLPPNLRVLSSLSKAYNITISSPGRLIILYHHLTMNSASVCMPMFVCIDVGHFLELKKNTWGVMDLRKDFLQNDMIFAQSFMDFGILFHDMYLFIVF